MHRGAECEVRAFGAPNTMVMDLLGEDRTFAAAAERHGKLFLCGEFGGHATHLLVPGERQEGRRAPVGFHADDIHARFVRM